YTRMIIISPSERVPIHSHNSNQSTRPLSMSLLGRAGLDLRSWVKSLRASHRIILICIIGFVLALLGLRILGTPADTYLALAFYLPRPSQVPSLGIMPRGEIPTNPGFPSGHTTNAFTVATVIWSRYPAWRVPFVLLAIATGVSMIILGLHFPGDVIGGVFLGMFCGTFVLGLAKLRSSK